MGRFAIKSDETDSTETPPPTGGRRSDFSEWGYRIDPEEIDAHIADLGELAEPALTGDVTRRRFILNEISRSTTEFAIGLYVSRRAVGVTLRLFEQFLITTFPH